MPTSNAGFSPRELQRREFQATAAATLDRQAGVIGQVVEAINQTNEQARVSREFVADLSTRIDSMTTDAFRLSLRVDGLASSRDAVMVRGFLGRMKWLLTGK
jgi:hypothetical protein